MDKEQMKKQVAKLVDRYNQEKSKKYNEEATKNDFILPLFKILGWNVEDSNEVSKEENISGKRVDYGFRIDGIPKFFLEAKGLDENLEGSRMVKGRQVTYAEQAINYAYYKGCNWAILTNFKGIVVYDAWAKSSQSSFRFAIWADSLLNDFDNNLYLLSREAFEQGLLDKKYSTKSRKRPITEQLLLDFTNFRAILSKDVYNLNKSKNLTEEELDEAIQRLFDRLIFVRSCEDRELEPYDLLSTLRQWKENKKGTLISRLRELFTHFDETYNSKIFNKHLCDQVEISDNALSRILDNLYTTEDGSIQYDFSLIDADVLGNIYEQYLGHILKKTKLTESKAKRKEEGIYYTPNYIVDYIVKNTVGELVKNKKVDVSKIKILDPACGSGSFLIKTFDVLNEYYSKKEGYNQNKLDRSGTGITYSTKLSILKDNIFGVDLDKQAVDIAQLNLLLKIAEKKRRLPILQQNIKNGNSLIDDSNIAGNKAFKWNEEFAEIMGNGGFDVIIGNPPYGIIFNENEKHFIEDNLPVFKRNNDVYVAFIEKAINLLNSEGLFSFIIPNTYLRGAYFDDLKKTILAKTKIIKILDFGTNHIFKDPNVFNSIIILQKELNQTRREKTRIEFFNVPKLNDLDLSKLEEVSIQTEINQAQFNDLIWKPKNNIIERINKGKNTALGEICYVKDVGFNYWSIGRGKKRGNSIGSRVLYDGERKNQKDIPYLKGRDISRYGYIFGNHWLQHDYKKLLDEKIDIFRFSSEYLEISPKLIYRQTADRIIATLDNNKYYLDKTVHLIVPKENKKIDLFYLLGLLNSKLIYYFYRDLVHEEGRTFAQVKTVYIKKIPLRFNKELEKKVSDLVTKELEYTKRLNDIGNKKTDQMTNIINDIKKLDSEIDNFIYKIYGITDEEKKMIEESLGSSL